MSSNSNMTWLDQQPRIELGQGPTPLEPLDRLSKELGGPRIWLKRDDCTGLATGGNKTRKLEYLMADALAQQADCIVTYGAVQSNHARQTAAACAKPCRGAAAVFHATQLHELWRRRWRAHGASAPPSASGAPSDARCKRRVNRRAAARKWAGESSSRNLCLRVP
mgnify:CR=1 FL=1